MRNRKPLPTRFLLILVLALSWVLTGCSPPGSDLDYRSQVIKREDIKPRVDEAPPSAASEAEAESTDTLEPSSESSETDQSGETEPEDAGPGDDPMPEVPMPEDAMPEGADGGEEQVAERSAGAETERSADGSRRLSPSEVKAAAMASRAKEEPFVPPDPPKKGSDGVLDLTFDHIKFDMQVGEKFERSLLPSRIEELTGQRVRIRGFILPGFQQRDIKQFVLVRDNMECCFGPGAALYDCVLIEMEGRGVDFTVRPITVEGIFDVDEYKSAEGEHLAIYRMDGTGVK